MATCIAQGICCCFSCCCQELSDSLKRLLGVEKVTKIFYLFLVVVFTVPAIIIMYFLNQWQGFLEYFHWLKCPQDSGGQFDCIGPSAIYRISLSFLILFMLMLLCTLCRNRLSMVINEGLFCFKYLIVLAIFIALLWVRNQTFNQYSQASKVISILFMILQSIILIDLFYLAGIKLVAKYDEGQSCYACLLIFFTIVAEMIAIGFNILGYVFFSSADSCGDSLWVNIVTSIVLFGLPFTQLFNFNKQNSLLTTALVSMYCSYLTFICQYSYGGSSCEERMNLGSFTADIIISTFFFMLTMYGSIMGGSGQVKVTEATDIGKTIGVVPPPDPELEESQQDSQRPIHPKPEPVDSDQANLQNNYNGTWRWPKWHFYMCLASIYVGMLITNWNSASVTTDNLVSNDFGFWVRLCISWATALLYTWTLVAPRICPSRDFTVV